MQKRGHGSESERKEQYMDARTHDEQHTLTCHLLEHNPYLTNAWQLLTGKAI